MPPESVIVQLLSFKNDTFAGWYFINDAGKPMYRVFMMAEIPKVVNGMTIIGQKEWMIQVVDVLPKDILAWQPMAAPPVPETEKVESPNATNDGQPGTDTASE
ncbi:MAG: hypothetical protein ABL951_04040 [Alphaproteobacteria bacterium]